MVRIIDKIHARRKEYIWERDAQNYNSSVSNLKDSHQPASPPPTEDADSIASEENIIPSHIRNRPTPPRRNRIVKPPSSPPTQQEEDISCTDKVHSTIQPGWYYSFEFFPPKTEPGLDNLQIRIDRMCRKLDPLFVSITWGANGSTLSRTMAVASHAQRFACVDVLLHLSCTGLTREQIGQVLTMAKSSGLRNILALRGDPPQGTRAWKVGDVSGGDCHRAIDLVRLIRQLHGDYFGIGVAGHPEGHPSSPKGEAGKILEMQHLKEKIDAGAQFIITQFFYDVNVFIDYVQRCRDAGIHCPIIPGIMPIQSFSSLIKMTQFCCISVPPSVINRLEEVRLDDEAVKKIGCEIATEMCHTILTTFMSRQQQQDQQQSDDNDKDDDDDWRVDGFHFYTLNLERSTTRILTNLDAVDIYSLKAGSSVSSREKQSNMMKDLESPTSNHEGEYVEIKPTTQSSEDYNGNSTANRRRERSESISDRARATRRVLPWKPSAMDNRSKEDVRPINWSNRYDSLWLYV